MQRRAAGQWARLWLATLVFLASAPAFAQSGFGLSPLRLDLSGARARASFVVTNPGSVPIVLQAQARAWRQDSGADRYTDTQAFVINPVIFRIEPGGSQTVRVALRAAPDAEREQGFRMLFTELPPPDAAAQSSGIGLRVVRQMNVPIFVAPLSGKSAPQGLIRANQDGNVLHVSFSNSGTGHWRLSELRMQSASDNQSLPGPQLVVVLPGNTRKVEVPLKPGTVVAALRVKAVATQGELDVTVPVEPAK